MMDRPEPSIGDFVLRLFVTGTTTRSQRAISNIRKICAEHLVGRCDLQVVDVYLDPESTRDYQIVATPTLVKVSPEPLRRIVGDLSDHVRVMASLNIAPAGGSLEARA